MSNEHKVSTESYKGVRDFYPEDQAIQNYIFSIWKSVVTKYGYSEYNASILESADLYRAKSGEEIVNEQTYTFKDRGDREVTLRPEMTPTVARMVAGRRRELSFPLRWFSIPNLFRYEQPQKGRLREHFQLNVDVFGIDSIHAEVEIIQISSDIMRGYGLTEKQFDIRLNNRKVMNYVTHDVFELSDEASHKLSKLIDKKHKVDGKVFAELAKDILGEKTDTFLTLLNSKNFEEFVSHLPRTSEEHVGIKEIKNVIDALDKLGIRNVRFDQTLMRGFDYYTGIVFEVFDTNPENRRSVFGGGRYDDLLSIFGNEKVPAVGFGTGDVTTKDLLITYNLIPKNLKGVSVAILPLEEKVISYADDIAQKFRSNGIATTVDYTGKKLGDKMKSADKAQVTYTIAIGANEVETGKLKVKRMSDGKETEVTEDTLTEGLE